MLDDPVLLLRKKVSLTFGPYAFENVYCEQLASAAETEGTCFQAKQLPKSKMQFLKICCLNTPLNSKPGKTVGTE